MTRERPNYWKKSGERGGGVESREIPAPYIDVFEGENVDLSGENTFFWRQSFKNSLS